MKTPSSALYGVVAAVLGGVALAVQSRLNGELGRQLGDGVAAALISFGGGLVVLLAATSATRTGRASAARFRDAVRHRRLRAWQCVGGVLGAFYVLSQGLAAAALGVALFTVAGVAGQVVSGLLVDRAGFGPGDPRPVTTPRAVGALLTVVAVGVAVADRLDAPGHLWLILLPLLAGAGLGVQQGLNGHVGKHSGGVLFATTLNFGVGMVALVVAEAVVVAVRGLPGPLPSDWHLYVGGLLGIVAISSTVYAVRTIGVLMLGLSAVAGQLIGAVLLDLTSGRLATGTVLGVALTLVAAAVAGVPRRTAPTG
ncbi:DMT family transporter [Actinokineospora sp. G85]|uniref:DMT family transporter n=1 Tax=Actinokineospora sp. G85 TaxID=3406626 RepID=UPI003C7698BA